MMELDVILMEPEYQRWLMALSAPMVALNIKYGARFYEPTFYEPGEPVSLSNSWGITSREGLISMINDMTDGGHAERLAYYYHLWHHLTASEWQQHCANQSEDVQGVLALVTETAALCGEGGIRAWDLGRMSFLSRIGLLNGWISEKENLWIHTRLADRARYYYRSWENYYAAFLIGRTYWLTLDEEDPECQRYIFSNASQNPDYIDQIGTLYTHPDCPIHDLDWDVDPIEMDKPESLPEAEI
ncbi:DUF1266 domain-containing protein [Pectobacterium brasiliense]|uniref:DUF1266 domain-containing protein n=1 Tax=Pectobacterium brasiliense TaxID=180957 RepID=UPI002A81233D|nr:DUF1266 domain-containing protein [Pectobacterium brasiliense]MDY4349810.1 DUF1266 domain-containing protein [Pectobacterium brasiliense]